MWLVDVNVLIYAFREQSTFHTSAKKWLEDRLSEEDLLFFSDLVELGFIRITNQISGMDFENSWSFIETIRQTPSYRSIQSGPRHALEFSRIIRSQKISVKHYTDAWLAALAIEKNATLVSYDQGFKNYPSLMWMQPPE